MEGGISQGRKSFETGGSRDLEASGTGQSCSNSSKSESRSNKPTGLVGLESLSSPSKLSGALCSRITSSDNALQNSVPQALAMRSSSPDYFVRGSWSPQEYNPVSAPSTQSPKMLKGPVLSRTWTDEDAHGNLVANGCFGAEVNGVSAKRRKGRGGDCGEHRFKRRLFVDVLEEDARCAQLHGVQPEASAAGHRTSDGKPCTSPARIANFTDMLGEALELHAGDVAMEAQGQAQVEQHEAELHQKGFLAMSQGLLSQPTRRRCGRERTRRKQLRVVRVETSAKIVAREELHELAGHSFTWNPEGEGEEDGYSTPHEASSSLAPCSHMPCPGAPVKRKRPSDQRLLRACNRDVHLAHIMRSLFS